MADRVVMTHGAPGDPRHYVHEPGDAAAQLAALPEARVLLVGHTHRPMAVDAHARAAAPEHVALGDARWLLNPGATGQSRERELHARVLELDLATGTARFRALPYDVERARAALRGAGLPEEALHRRPSSWLRRALRRTAATAGRRAARTASQLSTTIASHTRPKPDQRLAGMASPAISHPTRNCSTGARYCSSPTVDSGTRVARAGEEQQRDGGDRARCRPAAARGRPPRRERAVAGRLQHDRSRAPARTARSVSTASARRRPTRPASSAARRCRS